jgi:hypothetical protein
MRVIFWLAEDLLASQGGPCCMELVETDTNIAVDFQCKLFPRMRNTSNRNTECNITSVNTRNLKFILNKVQTFVASIAYIKRQQESLITLNTQAVGFT